MPLIDFPTPPSAFASALAEPLLVEWRRLDRRLATHRRIADWQIDGYTHDPVKGLDSLLSAVGMFGASDDSDADVRLAAVAALAADDDLAARVALHRILPALVSMARRRAQRYNSSPSATFDDVISHAWIVIRTYPIARRPTHIAAGLIREIEYQAFVRPYRLRSADEIPMSDGPVADAVARPEATEPMLVVIELLRDARNQGVPAEDLRFATAWANGASTVELATEFKMCERSVRNRRHRVAASLRSVAVANGHEWLDAA